MTITRLFPSGALEVSALRGGHLIRRTFHGYTRAQAIAEFRATYPARKRKQA